MVNRAFEDWNILAELSNIRVLYNSVAGDWACWSALSVITALNLMNLMSKPLSHGVVNVIMLYDAVSFDNAEGEDRTTLFKELDKAFEAYQSK